MFVCQQFFICGGLYKSKQGKCFFVTVSVGSTVMRRTGDVQRELGAGSSGVKAATSIFCIDCIDYIMLYISVIYILAFFKVS